MTYEYWQHEKSGEVYAVELNEEGLAERAYGPIHYTEITKQNLPHFDFDVEDGLFLRSLAHEYKRHEAKK